MLATGLGSLTNILAATINIQGSDTNRGENSVDVVESDQVSTRIEINTFSESAQKTEEIRKTDIVPSLAINPYFTETIVQFLQRPYPILNFGWTSSNAAGKRIGHVRFPDDLMSITSLWDKLKNFQFFRGGVKIGVRINGTKFHYGKLLICWSPQEQQLRDKTYNDVDNIFSASGKPHVIASPTENEVHEFVMPFCVPLNYIRLDSIGSAAYSMGSVSVYVLNTLKQGVTIAPVSVSLFASFVDVEIAGYTATSYTKPSKSVPRTQALITSPQLGVMPLSSIGNYSNIEAQMYMPLIEEGIDVAVPFVVDEVSLAYEGILSALGGGSQELVAQSNMTTTPSSGDSEGKSKSSSGLVSGIASKISQASAILSPIPFIGSYAALLSRFSAMTGRVAESLGYCNPLTQQPISKMKLDMPVLANTHGLDNAHSLSILPNNKVASCLELLGGFKEEQTLLSLVSTPSLLTSYTLTSSKSFGDSLLVIPVSPIACTGTLATSQYYRIYPTVLSHTVAPFGYWRGSLKYCLQITASAFHSCRLRIAWDPSSTTASAENQSNSISHILDIQEETEFHFTIPYMSENPYCLMGTPTGLKNHVNGYLHIYLVNELVHPVSPIPDINLNLWVMGGEDLQLAYPNISNLTSRGLNAKPIVPPTDESEDSEVEAQWATRETMRMADYPPLIPAVGACEENILFGESISTIKDLIKRPFSLYTLPLSEDTYQYGTLFAPPENCWNPAFSPSLFIPSTLFSSITGRPIVPNFLDHYRMLFRYARGSYGIKVFNYQGTSDNTSAAISLCPPHVRPWNPDTHIISYTSDTTPKGKTVRYQLGSGVHMSSNLKLQPLEINVPFYSGQYAFVNSRESLTQDVHYPPAFHLHYIDHSRVAIEELEVLMNAGDDFELIFQVGPPALYFGTT